MWLIPHGNPHVRARRFGLVLAVALLLAGCAAPPRTLRIALVGPFEGRYAATGYAAFTPFRQALQDGMRAGGFGGYQVSFVAYNDNGDPLFAERVARDVAIDPEVIAVIGHLRADTTRSALPVYEAAGLAVIDGTLPVERQVALVLATIGREVAAGREVTRAGVKMGLDGHK